MTAALINNHMGKDCCVSVLTLDQKRVAQCSCKAKICFGVIRIMDIIRKQSAAEPAGTTRNDLTGIQQCTKGISWH